jgi:inosose dehydratase
VTLRDAPIGCVPIVWNNADDHALAPLAPAGTVLDEIARLAFAGIQYGRGFPEGDELRRELGRRNLRFAELYSALPAGPDGLADGAAEMARRDLDRLAAAGGGVLVVALDGGGERDAWSGRVEVGAPQWSAAAYAGLAELLAELAGAAPDGVRVAFHPHTATWIEAPDEVSALAAKLPGTGAGICLDVGHYLVGGGEPARAIRAFGALVTHVHLKDVDPSVLARLRSGELAGFGPAVRERIFTELGNGALDLHGVLSTLDAIGYAGWLMVEQDSSWLPSAEAAAVGKRVLDYALRELDR